MTRVTTCGLGREIYCLINIANYTFDVGWWHNKHSERFIRNESYDVLTVQWSDVKSEFKTHNKLSITIIAHPDRATYTYPRCFDMHLFDSDMSFSDQIKSVSKSCHFHIRDIRRIRHLLPLSAATALANSLVSSKLDYCNSLYSGISQVNLNKLQRIQNSLARVITNTSKYHHITPILKKLHWLPIKQRIDYKLCLLTYKTLTNQQPTYLYNSLSFPSHSVSTRSSDSLVLSIPYVRSSLGKRAFSVIGPRLWNSLPPDTRNSSSLPIFRSRLKTYLFKIAFPP